MSVEFSVCDDGDVRFSVNEAEGVVCLTVHDAASARDDVSVWIPTATARALADVLLVVTR